MTTTQDDNELDRIFSKLSFGYEFQMSDYASNKETEDEYERQGLAEIAQAKAAIEAYKDNAVREVLDRLYKLAIYGHLAVPNCTHFIPLRALEAERNKLNQEEK